MTTEQERPWEDDNGFEWPRRLTSDGWEKADADYLNALEASRVQLLAALKALLPMAEAWQVELESFDKYEERDKLNPSSAAVDGLTAILQARQAIEATKG